AAVRSADAGVPASFGTDTGTASGSENSYGAHARAVAATSYTEAVAAAASADSLSSRAGGVPPASHPSGFSAYPSHGDPADGVSGRDSLRLPSSVRDTLSDPHWCRAMQEE